MTDLDPDVWRLVPGADELDIDEAVVLALKPAIAVYRLDDGFWATDDTCTHAEFSLAEGYVENGAVECDFHFATFDIRTGAVRKAPASVPLRTYPVQVVDDEVYVDVSTHQSCAIAQIPRMAD